MTLITLGIRIILKNELLNMLQALILAILKTRLPVELVYLQEFATRDEAFNAEHQIKKWNRKKKESPH